MKTKNKQYLKWLGILVLGIFLGWVLFGGYGDDHAGHTDMEAGQDQVWTCSMHPQIRQNEPGDCPICGMDLIPLEEEETGDAAIGYTMSENAMRLANVETMVVGSTTPERQIRLNGKVEIDERNSYSQSTHVPGRIENLRVNFTGERIQRGQTLATVYSPAMVTAQEELLQAARMRESQPELFRAAREKLRNWRISEAQIDHILEGNAPIQSFPITADVAGVVTDKMVSLGDYVERGMPIYEIADLSSVWVLFDLYERELTAINEGDEIEFTINSLPGETFEGTVSFIDPVISSQTRVATARVEVDNRNGRLKPEMFATGIVTSGTAGEGEEVVIPKSAVLWTGTRSVVYLKESVNGNSNFRMQEVSLGSSLGNSYIVLSGLQAGDEIVTNGTFTVDAAVQLSGRPSMMNPEQGSGLDGAGVDLSPDEAAAIEDLIGAYLQLKDALVEDDLEGSRGAAGELQDAVENIDYKDMNPGAEELWGRVNSSLKDSGKQIEEAGNIADLRAHFDEFSSAMIQLLEHLELPSQELYVQRCPMADNDRGADWLSRSREIRNPYYGKAMLTCGEVISVIE